MTQAVPLDDRVAELERRMGDVEDLARNTDQDVADWRTTLNNHTKTINAWGEQINARFDRVEAEMRSEFADVRLEMRTGFGTLAEGQAKITKLLTKHLGEPDDETPAGGASE